MENNTGNSNGKVIGAVLLGAVVGAALGILFAPDKGSETRKRIMAKGRDLRDKAEDMLENATGGSGSGSGSSSGLGKYDKKTS